MVAAVILVQLASLAPALALPLVGVGLGTLLEDGANSQTVRDKREPSRSMTFSGFMPGSGLSAFATSGDFGPYTGYGRRPQQPAGEEQPPERGQSPWQPEDKESEDKEQEEPAPRPGKKNRKKYYTKEEDEEEYEKPSSGRGGNAAASFNAWFPIMLGMFPSSGYPGGEGGYSRGYPQGGHGSGYGPGQGGQGGPQGGSGYPQGGPHTTVIANSVSNGRSGVASSHAIAYGGGGGSGGGGGGGPHHQQQRWGDQ